MALCRAGKHSGGAARTRRRARIGVLPRRTSATVRRAGRLAGLAGGALTTSWLPRGTKFAGQALDARRGCGRADVASCFAIFARGNAAVAVGARETFNTGCARRGRRAARSGGTSRAGRHSRGIAHESSRARSARFDNTAAGVGAQCAVHASLVARRGTVLAPFAIAAPHIQLLIRAECGSFELVVVLHVRDGECVVCVVFRVHLTRGWVGGRG